MNYLSEYWRRHKKKIFVTTGLLGSAYFLYKFYNGQKNRLDHLEKELAMEQENEELVKAQMQAHFETIQNIADTSTLPHAMQSLSNRLVEELDLASILKRLNKEKSTLTALEKRELWDRLKVLSFTGMVMSLWALTMLSLYIRVQVNILGRHLYIDTVRGLGSSHLLEDTNLIDRDAEQKFLASSDFLASCIPTLITDMQESVTEILKGKQLKDFFNTTVLREIIMQILDMFMSTERSHHWVDYLMAGDTMLNKQLTVSTNENTTFSDVTKFDQLMAETREVLLSAEFAGIVDTSLEIVVDAFTKELEVESEGSLMSGMPLAKLLPRVARVTPSLFSESSKNRFIQNIRTLPKVEVFFTLLYANTPAS